MQAAERDDMVAVPMRATLVAGSLVGVLALLYLVPIVSAGLSPDEAALGQLAGFRGYEDLGLMDTLRVVTSELAADQGGWFPTTMARAALWLLFPDPVFGKVIQLLVVVANVVTMTMLTGILARSAAFGALSGLGTLLALQLRKPHDAVLGGSFCYPVALEIVLLALCAYALFVVSRRPLWFIVAVTLELLACTFNESAYLLAIVFPLVDAMRSRGSALGFVFLLAPASLVAVTIASHLPPPASLTWLIQGSGSDLQLAGKQLVAALPTSYRAFGNVLRDGVPGYFSDTRFDAIPSVDMLGRITLCGLATSVYFFATKQQSRPIPLRRMSSFALIASVFLLTAALMHDPHEWGRGFPLGEAFKSIYFAYFGCGVLFALFVELSCSGLPKTVVSGVVPTAFALIALVVAYGNVRINEHVVALQRADYETINLVTMAAQRGLLRGVPDKALIWFDVRAPFETTLPAGFQNVKYLLYAATGRRFQVVDSRELRRQHRFRQAWVIRREYRGSLRGGITVAQITGWSHGEPLVDQSLGFRRYPSVQQRDEVLAQLRAARGVLALNSVDVPRTEMIVDVSRVCGSVPLGSMYRSDDVRWAYGAGFYKPSLYKRWNFWVTYFLIGEFTAGQPWRYAGALSDLVVSNDACGAPRPLRFAAYAFTAAPGFVTIAAPGIRQLLSISSSGRYITLEVPPTRLRRFNISFAVQATAAQEELGMPHFLADELGPARLVLVNPSIAPADR